MLRRRPIAIAFLVSLSCTPRACDDTDDDLARDVEILLGESDRAADGAEARLIAQGRPAIVMLESGLYQAEPRGRLRIVQVLAAIGNPEAAPILRHLAEHDPDDGVRQAAAEGLSALASP